MPIILLYDDFLKEALEHLTSAFHVKKWFIFLWSWTRATLPVGVIIYSAKHLQY